MFVLIPLTALITPPVTIKAFDVPPVPPVRVQVPVIAPVLDADPLVTFAVFNVIMLPVVTFAVAIVAFAVTVAKRTVIVSPINAFTAVILFACKLPVTVTEPNVVVPEPPDCASVIQELAVVVPSAGQTHNV